MPDPSPSGQERLTRFLASLVYEIGEERVARILSRVDEGYAAPSILSRQLGERYAEDILELDFANG